MLKFHTRSEFGIEPVATTEGIVAIAPDYVAQGFISAMSELFGNTDDVERAYVKASYEAARKLTDGLQDAEFFSWAMVAIERHETDAA
jgi:hypothetical protein